MSARTSAPRQPASSAGATAYPGDLAGLRRPARGLGDEPPTGLGAILINADASFGDYSLISDQRAVAMIQR